MSSPSTFRANMSPSISNSEIKMSVFNSSIEDSRAERCRRSSKSSNCACRDHRRIKSDSYVRRIVRVFRSGDMYKSQCKLAIRANV